MRFGAGLGFKLGVCLAVNQNVAIARDNAVYWLCVSTTGHCPCRSLPSSGQNLAHQSGSAEPLHILGSHLSKRFIDRGQLAPRCLDGVPLLLQPEAGAGRGCLPRNPRHTSGVDLECRSKAGWSKLCLDWSEACGRAGVAAPERHARAGHPQQQELLRGHADQGRAGALELHPGARSRLFDIAFMPRAIAELACPTLHESKMLPGASCGMLAHILWRMVS